MRVCHMHRSLLVSTRLRTMLVVLVGVLACLSPAALRAISTSVTAPVFTPAGGAYTSGQLVTISTATPGASIYYTTDGTAPGTTSTLYTAPVPICATTTLKAIAVLSGSNASAVATAVYTIANSINFSDGFASAPGQMQFNGTATLSGSNLQLTDGGIYEAASAFSATPVNIQAFTTSFNFQLLEPSADGITFTIQNQAPTALGLLGGALGYAGITNSVAIKFDLFNNNGEGRDSSGLYVNGATPTVPSTDLTYTGISLHSGDLFNVQMIYDGTNLNLTLTDTVTLVSWSKLFAINIPATVGGPTAYVGFTGGSGGYGAIQEITSWIYSMIPPVPSFPNGFCCVAGMQLNGTAAFSGSTLQLTDGGIYEASSAFYTTRVNVQSFTSDFTLNILQPSADGFTFTIQALGPKALGLDGGGLGYAHIPVSIAIKFDLFDNAGEGPNSTGMYGNGTLPTLPSSVNMTGTGIDLHSGHPFKAHMTYNGTALNVTITDTTTLASFSKSYTINIPGVIGASTGYVGFTAGTGGFVSIPEITSWSYTPGAPAAQ